MAVTSKKVRREGSRFTLQFEVSHKESQRLVYLGANCFFEGLFTGRKQHGMGTELVFTKRTQTSIYNSVTVGFARRNSIYGFFFPIWCRLYIHAVPNECKKLIPFQFFIGF